MDFSISTDEGTSGKLSSIAEKAKATSSCLLPVVDNPLQLVQSNALIIRIHFEYKYIRIKENITQKKPPSTTSR